MSTFRIRDEGKDLTRTAELAALFQRAGWTATLSEHPTCLLIHQTDLARKDLDAGGQVTQSGGAFVRYSGGSVPWEVLEREFYGSYDELVLRLDAWSGEGNTYERLVHWLACDLKTVASFWEVMTACALMCEGFLLAHVASGAATLATSDRSEILEVLGVSEHCRHDPEWLDSLHGERFAPSSEMRQWWHAGCGERRPPFRTDRCQELGRTLWPAVGQAEGASGSRIDVPMVLAAYRELAELIRRGVGA